MVNDLIRRSALLEEMRKFSGNQRYLIPEKVWGMVKNAPTAYDVYKVVGNLEELREEILSGTEYDNDTVNYYLGYVDSMIEIVKSGGISKW